MLVHRCALLGALALTAGVLAPSSSAVAAQPAPKGEPSGAAAPAVAGCDLRPTANRSDRHEWRSCIGVTATLDRLPAVGQTATLSVEVRADAARPGARITVELPANLAFVDPPAGAAVAHGLARLEAALRARTAGASF
jgi:hypothetical protein